MSDDRYHPMSVNQLDYEKLDPGIRDDVKKLIDAGFITTDSGDGISKSADEYPEALPFPHIAMESPSTNLAWWAEEASKILGESWIVEGSYSTRGKKFILFAYKD